MNIYLVNFQSKRKRFVLSDVGRIECIGFVNDYGLMAIGPSMLTKTCKLLKIYINI